MKIALFSDIHANLPALEAFFRDVETRNPDSIYCLGDLVGYNVWPNEVIREIRKPVAGSVRVAVAGIEAAPGDFTVDEATGRIEFAEPPTVGRVVTAGFLFDTPVRFDSDRIEVTLEGFDAARMVAMPLIELRV